jgi:hypothetical protein
MTNISNVTRDGAASFRKARRERPRIRRRRAQGHLAFTVSTLHSRYIVRLAIESGRVGECVQADSGVPCEGFKREGHCYHLDRALVLIGGE